MTSDLSDMKIQLQALTALVTRAIAKSCLASGHPEVELKDWQAALEADGDGMMKLAFADAEASDEAKLGALRYAGELTELAKRISDDFSDLTNRR
jgi:hypothetical protein